MTDPATTVRRFWETTEARDWEGLAALLSADFVYRCEQTRERVRGREAFLRYYTEFPGEWHVAVRRVVADDAGAASVIDATLGDTPMVGLAWFVAGDDGLTEMDEWWPEPYDPPADRAGLTERY
jgi:hypothetical protein